MLMASANHSCVANAVHHSIASHGGLKILVAGRDIEAGTDSDSIDIAELVDMEPYPGVHYLGVGYDFAAGNPSGDPQFMLDPGFRQPVRTMSYRKDWITRDGKYKVPVGAYSMPMFSCQVRSTTAPPPPPPM